MGTTSQRPKDQNGDRIIASKGFGGFSWEESLHYSQRINQACYNPVENLS